MFGQINRGSLLGELIYTTVLRPEVSTIVEIGTWNGLGSTKCVLDALKKKDSYQFISVESSPTVYAEALKNVGEIPKGVELLLGRIVDPKDITTQNLRHEQATWLKEDLENYAIIPNVIDKIYLWIDLLILDGGEFTSEMEFNLLADRTLYVILDDTNPATGTLKFPKVRDRILRGETPFKVLDDRIEDRNGWLFGKRIKDTRNDSEDR